MAKSRVMAFTWSTLKNLFSKPVTKNYPAEPINYPERSRGHIDIEIDKCISCSMCAKVCPTGCITVDRKALTWEINRFDCLACGYCTLKCPKKCLHLTPGYQTPGGEKLPARYQRPTPPPKPAAPAAAPAAAAGAAKAPGTAAAPKATLKGDIVTFANGKTMDLSKLPSDKKAATLKKLGRDQPAEAKAPAADAGPKATRSGDIVTLPNGKTMDLSKLPEANREKVLAKLGLK